MAFHHLRLEREAGIATAAVALRRIAAATARLLPGG